MPRRIDDGSPGHQFQSPKDMFQHTYFEVLDVVCQEIQDRFQQNDLQIVPEMEKVLLGSTNRVSCSVPDKIKSLYSSDLNIDHLTLHLNMLPVLIKQYGVTNGTQIKKVTNVRTVCEAFSSMPGSNDLLSEVQHLLQLYLTVPVTTATYVGTYLLLSTKGQVISSHYNDIRETKPLTLALLP